MPRVSKYKIQEDKLKDIIDHFSYLIASLSQKGEVEKFIGEFLTKEEKIMLSKRLVLFMMLKRNYLPSQIRSGLNISYETIRVYQNQLDNKSKEFHQKIEKLVGRQKSKEFFDKVDKFLKPLEYALNSKTSMKARAKFLP